MSLWALGAVELASRIRRGEVSAREVVESHLSRIDQVNGPINAIVTLVSELALEAAARADQAHAAGSTLGPLHGLPVAHKDLVDTAGIRTTYGSPLFADHVPKVDGLVVTRARAAGAITIGKTNTPEFGAGSHTFNPVFGVTRNPRAPDTSAGGSSGGAAAALASGMVPLADGSDLGGSLRNPASFCGVVGLRPSPGRVPSWPAAMPWQSMSVEGPMGRSVADVALFLSALAGPDRRIPISLDDGGETFSPPLQSRPVHDLRVAFSPDLGGLPVDAEVAVVTRRAVDGIADSGAAVTEVDPPLPAADQVFETLRAWSMAATRADLYDRAADGMKETVRWNIERGRAQSGAEVGAAELARGAIFAAMGDFFERFDVLVTPVSQVPPFPVEWEYPVEVDGTPMATYIEWMRSCSRISVTSCPALSLPAGTTAGGLPVGIQLVAPHRAERRLLEIAAGFEQILAIDCGPGFAWGRSAR
jgi:amidase